METSKNAMNPPEEVKNLPEEVKKSPEVLSQELSERIKNLDVLVKDMAKNFVKIGYELFLIQQKKLYKELGFN